MANAMCMMICICLVILENNQWVLQLPLVEAHSHTKKYYFILKKKETHFILMPVVGYATISVKQLSKEKD